MNLYTRLKRIQRKSQLSQQELILHKARKEQWTPLAQRLQVSLINDKRNKLKGDNAFS